MAIKNVQEFLSLLMDLKTKLLDPQPRSFSLRLTDFFTHMGYRQLVFNSYKDKSVAQRKWNLVEILGRILDGFVQKSGLSAKTLREFIEALELRDLGDKEEENQNKVQLLTLHASKGLEFPVVILMGMDEGLLPHETLGSDISEERRLFYVGVTRAKKELVLTRAKKRKRYGKWREVAPSRFLSEIPAHHWKIYEEGFRPLKENDRKSLLADLYKRIEAKDKYSEDRF